MPWAEEDVNRDPGAVVEGFDVVKRLGRGGTATVYLAHRTAPRSGEGPIALKVLADDHRDEGNLGRLKREFEFAGRLEHPHIVTVHDRGPFWLAMHYVDGGNVSSLHSLENRLIALTQIADALDFVHRKGIVHGDVKPSNILVYKDFSAGGAVLIDFAVAHSVAEDMAARLSRDSTQRLSLDPAKRITHQQHATGPRVQASLPYAAPELLLGRAPSAAVDEYALACTAVELIAGTPPFVEKTSFALVDAQLHRPPPAISHRVSWIPRAFDSILAKAMAKDPEMRYESCSEFVKLISRAVR